MSLFDKMLGGTRRALGADVLEEAEQGGQFSKRWEIVWDPRLLRYIVFAPGKGYHQKTTFATHREAAAYVASQLSQQSAAVKKQLPWPPQRVAKGPAKGQRTQQDKQIIDDAARALHRASNLFNGECSGYAEAFQLVGRALFVAEHFDEFGMVLEAKQLLKANEKDIARCLDEPPDVEEIEKDAFEAGREAAFDSFECSDHCDDWCNEECAENCDEHCELWCEAREDGVYRKGYDEGYDDATDDCPDKTTWAMNKRPRR